MNVLDPHLAHHEIERRLRDAGHYRRISWGHLNRRIGTGCARRDCGGECRLHEAGRARSGVTNDALKIQQWDCRS